jgi:hypothetical protein
LAFGAAWQEWRKGRKEATSSPEVEIRGGIVDNRTTIENTAALIALARTIQTSDLDRRRDEMDLRECMLRLTDAMNSASRALENDPTDRLIADVLSRIDRGTGPTP